MQDFYMFGALLASFGLFYGFLTWCASVIEKTGGEGQ